MVRLFSFTKKEDYLSGSSDDEGTSSGPDLTNTELKNCVEFLTQKVETRKAAAAKTKLLTRIQKKTSRILYSVIGKEIKEKLDNSEMASDLTQSTSDSESSESDDDYTSSLTERYCCAKLTNKVTLLEIEKARLMRSLEDINNHRSGLELNQMELENKIRNLKFWLKQEQEDHCNTTTEKLKMEEQRQLDLQEKEKVEFKLMNEELENRKLKDNLKELEDDYSETQSLLTKERSARMALEKQMNNCLLKQQELEEENTMNMSKCNEALSQLAAASDREKELQQQIATLQKQLLTQRGDLGSSQKIFKEETEDLKLKSSLVSELSKTTSDLENEQSCETLQAELKSTRSLLARVKKETEVSCAARSETERTLLLEKEHQRLKDKYSSEVANPRGANNSLSEMLIKPEAQADLMKNELRQVKRELSASVAHVMQLEKTLQAERERFLQDRGHRETTQEELFRLQEEKIEMLDSVTQLEQELADSVKKLSVSRASLNDSLRYQRGLEEEKARLSKNVDRLRQKIHAEKIKKEKTEQEKKAIKTQLHQVLTRQRDFKRQMEWFDTVFKTVRSSSLDLERGELHSGSLGQRRNEPRCTGAVEETLRNILEAMSLEISQISSERCSGGSSGEL